MTPTLHGHMERGKKAESLSSQMKRKADAPVVKAEKGQDGDFTKVISTGSTLLDLAISGGRVRGGGIPGGIMVEIFGPSGTGKTVLLSEIAGGVQRQGGQVKFRDPEGRLNKQFARIFDLDTDEIDYTQPNTVTEIFADIQSWQPEGKKVIHGLFADSLAALSTGMEMEKEEGDKMGMRRAKDFSEGFRKNCRILVEKNYLMVCSNQVRDNVDGGLYAPKYKTPGGNAIGFYSSLRLRAGTPTKITKEESIRGKKEKRVVGIETTFEVFKSSIWKPYRSAPVIISFDYGIDDIRANLQFVKRYSGATTYNVGDLKLGRSLEDAIEAIEESNLERKLREQTIDLWEEIEEKFSSDRKKKRR